MPLMYSTLCSKLLFLNKKKKSFYLNNNHSDKDLLVSLDSNKECRPQSYSYFTKVMMATHGYTPSKHTYLLPRKKEINGKSY